MKVALAIRAAMLAIALIVMLAPLPYLGPEAPHHAHLSFLDSIAVAPHERFVIVWWAACAVALAWAEFARRRGGDSGVARAVRWIAVLAASVLVFVRPIGASEHVDRLQGAGVIDVAALAYLIAMIAGTVAWLAEAET